MDGGSGSNNTEALLWMVGFLGIILSAIAFVAIDIKLGQESGKYREDF